MSDLEDRIRAALHDPRRQIPAWPDPMPRIRRAARRQRLRRVLTSAVVTAAAVIAVVAIVRNLPVADNGPSGPGGAFSSTRSASPKATRPASPKPNRSALPPVGAPGYPAAIYPAAVRPRSGGAAVVAACPAPAGLVKPPASARATAAAITGRWGTANRAALLHAADRAIWPDIASNSLTYRAHGRRHQTEPILYAGLLKAEHRNLGAPDPSGFIRSSCGTATVDRSYLVVTGRQSEPALQEDWVFVDRAGHLLLYFTYP